MYGPACSFVLCCGLLTFLFVLFLIFFLFGNTTQLDRDSVDKETGCGSFPAQETLGIIRGGGQILRPTHPSEDPPPPTPHPIAK